MRYQYLDGNIPYTQQTIVRTFSLLLLAYYLE